ncbi:hypothetical protein SSP531S_20830 [Streptomyces spongiicola]|uniref:Uncharacterized protein n=1 Tax=Streptomyces spongiicola TaxID=1690221 RepID=A0A388T0A5_9ACTN|nr:hypothetical protein SSP531S_20830 [Streptomyces spongiicola]
MSRGCGRLLEQRVREVGRGAALGPRLRGKPRHSGGTGGGSRVTRGGGATHGYGNGYRNRNG